MDYIKGNDYSHESAVAYVSGSREIYAGSPWFLETLANGVFDYYRPMLDRGQQQRASAAYDVNPLYGAAIAFGLYHMIGTQRNRTPKAQKSKTFVKKGSKKKKNKGDDRDKKNK